MKKPKVTIEGVEIKKLSTDFVELYFEDTLGTRNVINEYKKLSWQECLKDVEKLIEDMWDNQNNPEDYDKALEELKSKVQELRKHGHTNKTNN